MNTNLFADYPLGSWLFNQINIYFVIYRPLLPLTPLQDKQQLDNLLVLVVGFVWFDSIWFIAFLLDPKASAVSAKQNKWARPRGKDWRDKGQHTAGTSSRAESWIQSSPSQGKLESTLLSLGWQHLITWVLWGMSHKTGHVFPKGLARAVELGLFSQSFLPKTTFQKWIFQP